MDHQQGIKVFSGRNEDYYNWKMVFTATMTIKKLGLWARGKAPRRPKTEEEGSAAWDEKNMEFFSYILLALDAGTAKAVATASTDRDGIAAWDQLISLFEKRDPLNISNLRSEINRISLKEGGDVQEYISVHRSLMERIWYGEGEEAVSKTSKIAYFLRGLPLSMRSWVFLKNTQKDLTIKDLRSKLRTNVDFKKASLHSSSHRPDESSFYSQNNRREGKHVPPHHGGPFPQNERKTAHKLNNSSVIDCYYCGKMGHMQAECRKRIANEKSRSSSIHGAKSSSKSASQKNSSKIKESSMVANEIPATIITGISLSKRDNDISTIDSDSKSQNKSKDYSEEDVTYVTTQIPHQEVWVINSRASSHMCHNSSQFENLKSMEGSISGADGRPIPITGQGRVRILTLDSAGEKRILKLERVLLVPSLEHNLFSIRAVAEKGHRTVFEEDGGYIEINGGPLYVVFQRRGNLFALTPLQETSLNVSQNITPMSPQHRTDSIKSSGGAPLETWHSRMGHQNMEAIKKLSSSVNGMKLSDLHNKACEICVETKMAKKPFPHSTTHASAPNQLIHSDVAGPMRVPTREEGHWYVINFVDDFSCHTVVYMMASKAEALNRFERYISEYGKPTKVICEQPDANGDHPISPSSLWTNNRGEYTSHEFKKFCLNHGIKRELTIPHTLQQNGVAERQWRTLFDSTRAMLKDASMNENWWGQAIMTAAYIQNHSLTRVNPDCKTPHEKFTGKILDLSNI